MKVSFYTIVALVAFAANSLLCRMALADNYIDPWNFTILRLLSGAVCLGFVIILHSKRLKITVSANLDSVENVEAKSNQQITFIKDTLNDKGSWLSSLSLLVYALCFSLAYVELNTGTGALILFATVQFTMIGWGIYKKERLSLVQWLALAIALTGFVYLMLPSATVPSFTSAFIMALSGIAWGVYSIRGKACVSPLRATGFNFIRSIVAIPLLLIMSISYFETISLQGIILAIISGAITSGLGYCLWYVALPLLKSTQAAVVQFCVPILAALAGFIFLSESLTLRFIIASSVILIAVLVFVMNKTPTMITKSSYQ